MLKRFKAFEASKIYKFKDPDTGYIHTGNSQRELIRLIILYRLQNQLEPIEELDKVVENYLCSLPENCHKCVSDVELDRTFYHYVKGGIQLVKNMFFKKFASQEEAEKRALQCVECKYNVFPDKKGFLKWSDDVMIQQVGEKRVSVHDKLGNCEVCTCVLKSKVFFGGSLDAFKKDEVSKLKEVNCWQLKLSGQDG